MVEAYFDPADFSRAFQESGLTGALITEFRRIIYQYYEKQGRKMPWRETRDPYKILISEIMLQQTQVERVLAKYNIFLEQFPNFASLARTPRREILLAWQGLGYNRRAIALQKIAQKVTAEFGGQLPRERQVLENLPGIGAATAGALMAFAFEQPTVFIETNVRRVFLHFFYPHMEAVPDKKLWLLIMLTLDVQEVRSWYYALMDYGAMLKKKIPNPNRRSAHYARQSPFQGSNRQIRSWIIQLFLQAPELSENFILEKTGSDAARVKRILAQLTQENLVSCQSGLYRLATGLEAAGEGKRRGGLDNPPRS
jgi:A/G-specific adenine glycosylase